MATVDIDSKTFLALRRLAKRQGRTESEVLREAVDRYVEEHGDSGELDDDVE